MNTCPYVCNNKTIYGYCMSTVCINPMYNQRTINGGLTADYVQVVRCKDCKHFKRDIPCVGGTYNGCDQLEGRDGCEPYVEEDFFCAYGERKDTADG